MINLKALDHVAFAVPDLAEQVARFQAMGMQVQQHVATYALMVDPASGFKIELNQEEGPARFRHLGFTTDDVDAAHEGLLEAGVGSVEAPHRREFAKMRTAFLKDGNGMEYQLVRYDEAR